jgi:hypothetical protein
MAAEELPPPERYAGQDPKPPRRRRTDEDQTRTARRRNAGQPEPAEGAEWRPPPADPPPEQIEGSLLDPDALGESVVAVPLDRPFVSHCDAGHERGCVKFVQHFAVEVVDAGGSGVVEVVVHL